MLSHWWTATVHNQKSNYMIVLHNFKCISVIIHTTVVFFSSSMFNEYGGWCVCLDSEITLYH